MTMLSDDPTYPAVALGVLALGFLVMLKVTQQGKYLAWGGAALGLALLWLLVERLWVTDAERIEGVVYAVADGVAREDVDAVAEHLAPDCRLEPDSGANSLLRYVSRLAGPIDRAKLEAHLPNFEFDFVRVSRLVAHAGKQSGRGTADFQVQFLGMQKEPQHGIATSMGWSLGFREVEPRVWKIERITPGRMPFGER